MNSKEFLTRIQMKRDTSSNWVVNNPVLLDGEVVIVDTDAGAVRYKVGDGTKKFTQLPFTDENMLNLVNNKQDRLTIDATPTSGSTNPVMSGGVVSYAVPQTRTINGKALSANISLTASDVGADASGAASTALNNAKTYTNQEIASVKSLVSTTYETQSSASTKLAEAKAYTDTAVADLADADHNHDDRYFTESKLNSVLGSYETKDDASDKLATAKSYTDTKVSGLVSSSTVDSKISTHNTASGAHSDIRAALTSLTTKVTNFLDVDEETTDQLSEVLAMIDANKGTLTSLTTSKVNVSDIVNNLTTNSTSKVLSAAQGVQIQTLISGLEDELDTHAANKSNPHAVTKAQVGLGNVPNVATNDQTPTYTAATTLETLTSGEKLSVSLGKIMKAITDLISHIGNKSNPHGVTAAQVGAAASSHGHDLADLGVMRADNIYGAPVFGDNDLNNWTQPGVYNCPSGATNVPSGLTDNYGVVAVFIVHGIENNLIQIFSPWTSSESKIYVRTKNRTVWNAWKAIATKTEIWTFTLEDGSTVTKAVYVG